MKKETHELHCPIVVFDFFEEYPKLMHFRIDSGSIPPPSSIRNTHHFLQLIKKLCKKPYLLIY